MDLYNILSKTVKIKKNIHEMFDIKKSKLKQHDEETLYIKDEAYSRKMIFVRFSQNIKDKNAKPLHIHDVCDVHIKKGCSCACFNTSIETTYNLCDDVNVDRFKIFEEQRYLLVLLKVSYHV